MTKSKHKITIEGKDNLYYLLRIVEAYLDFYGNEDIQDKLAIKIYDKIFKILYNK